MIALIHDAAVIAKLLRRLWDKSRVARAEPWAMGPPACGGRSGRADFERFDA